VKKRNRLAAIAAAALVGCAGMACFADQPTTQPSTQSDYNQEIKALRQRLDDLEARQKEADQKRLEAEQKLEAQQTEDAVRHDLDHRDRLLDVSGLSSGFVNDRFVIQSDDGRFVLRPWFHLQVRDVTLWRQDLKAGNRDDIENGFEIRRVKFGLDGNMFTPDFTYFFNWATSRANGTANVTNSSGTKIGTVSNNLGGVPILEEAWVKYKFPGTDFYVKGGQIKDPLLHDQIVSSRYQQSAERSLTADIFANGDAFTEGVTLIYDPKSFIRTEAGVNHGIRSANTNFLDPTTNGYNYGVAGRAELKAMGQWKDYGQVGAVGVKERLLVFGLGADMSERGHAQQLVFAADAQYASPIGLNFYGAYVGRYTNHNFGIPSQTGTGASFATPDPIVANRSTYEFSALGEIGYLIAEHWEPFGRVEYFNLRGTAAGSRNDFTAITGGVNYYFVGHRAKLTAEAVYLPQGIPIDDGASDVLTNPNGRGELSGVVQFQLLL
jgi:hypothetical protein